MIKFKLTSVLIAISSFFLLSNQSYSQNQRSTSEKFDTHLMEQDIEIMESVLDKLILTNDLHRIPLQATTSRGIYVPGYGVIFSISGSTNTSSIVFEEIINSTFGENAMQKIRIGNATSDHPDNKDEIEHFLLNYSSGLRQLKNSERVIVVYSESNPGAVSSGKTIDSLFVFSGVLADILNYKNNNTSPAPIKREKIASFQYTHKDLFILSNIFKTAFSSHESGKFMIQGDIRVLRLSGLGDILQFDVFNASRNSFEYYFYSESSAEFGNRSGNPAKTVSGGQQPGILSHFSVIDTASSRMAKENYDEFEDQLRDLVFQYGATLSSSGSKDKLIVAVKIHGGNIELPSRLVLQARQHDLQALAKGKISKTRAAKNMVWNRYY